jgi:TolB-like protein
MARAAQSVPSERQKASAADRLDSWKEIAEYLRRSVRTVHRWESEEGLPVHRHLHESSGTVYAFKHELDTWWASRTVECEPTPETLEEKATEVSRSRPSAKVMRWLVVGVVVAAAALASIAYWRQRLSANVTVIRSIAVLPLDDLTGDSGQKYAVDWMTDALTTELARGRVLEVPSRTSAAQYKGSRQSVRTIARNLGVDAVVEGTVSRIEQHLEINVQVIQASSDRHLWAERYERDLAGLDALPGEIAWDIVRAIPADIPPGTQRQLAHTRPANANAYEAYVRGRYFWSMRGSENLLKALKYFNQAIEADPSYAPAYSGLSDTYRLSTNILGHLPQRHARASVTDYLLAVDLHRRTANLSAF